MINGQKQIYEFGDFRLDLMKRQLTRSGELVPLYSKAFDLLAALVQNDGRDLTKDELLEAVWPGQILEEANLTVTMSVVRKALREKAAEPRFIVTIPGRGYRFVGKLHPQSGLLIESETIAQITFQEEVDDSVAVRPVAGNEPAATALESSRMSPLAVRQLSRRSVAVTAVLVVVALLIATMVLTVYWLRQSRSAASRFQQIRLRQLTNDGGIKNAALSPDGRFFIFVHVEKGGRESLRLGQMNGQPSRELRTGDGLHYRGLEFSRDGGAVYYVVADEEHHGALYKLPVLGGVPVRLRDKIGPNFSLAPDEQRLVFVRSDPDQKTINFIISNLDGSNERTFLNVPIDRNFSSLRLAWSPDGSTIAMAGNPEGNQTAQTIYLKSVNGGELRPLTSAQWLDIYKIAWLKDGSGILAIATTPGADEDRQLWLAAYPGGETRRITNDLTNYTLMLSVDSSSNNILTGQISRMSNIWVAPADDLSRFRQLTFGASNRSEGTLGLDWTPDGRIVYASSIGKKWAIWIMDGDGTNARQLTPPGSIDSVPVVTGDGRYIVFDSDRTGSVQIWRINIDGNNPRQLTSCGDNSQPSVTSDGRWVVFGSSCDPAGAALWHVSIDGGEPKRLTEKPAWWPRISPDDKLIACEYAVAPKQSKLAVVPIDGGPPVKIFDVPPNANFRYAIRWTADGKAITYRDWISGIWRQSLDGGPPQRLQGLPEEKIYSNAWSRDGKLFAFTRGYEVSDAVLVTSER